MLAALGYLTPLPLNISETNLADDPEADIPQGRLINILDRIPEDHRANAVRIIKEVRLYFALHSTHTATTKTVFGVWIAGMDPIHGTPAASKTRVNACIAHAISETGAGAAPAAGTI